VGKASHPATDHPSVSKSAIPSSLPVGTSQIIVPQLFSSREPVSSPTPSPPDINESLLELGYREPEEDESSLIIVLDSSIPFIRDNNAPLKLPTYLGKAIHDPAVQSEATSSKTLPAREGKEFTWYRGIGLELSPIKTQSS